MSGLPFVTFCARFYCPKCGIVRDSDGAPWCRHNDIALPAARMVPIFKGHPLYDVKGSA